MKFTIALLTLALLQAHGGAFSQNVTLSGDHMPLKKIFDKLEKQTGYTFFFNKELLNLSQPVTVHLKDLPLADALKICFEHQPLGYSIQNKTIFIREELPVVGNADPKLQAKTITGTVTDSSGNPLEGVSVQIKGASKGTVTNSKGDFKIDAPDNATLVFTSVGYQRQEIAVSSGATLEIKLLPLLQEGSDVVVTALGIKRPQRLLSYEVQQVDGDQLNQVKQTNVINSLSGKVAGLSVLPSASGVGGSVKVRLRGSRSIAGNNQPLYVIDGIPMLNAGNGQPEIGGFTGQTYFDPGDGISNLNPDDIASITVLQGANAAALYGSQAQNGVILITTKKGKEGKLDIGYTSSVQSDHIAYKPKFQNRYGYGPVSSAGDFQSWGGDTVKHNYDNVDAFLRTGVNFTNAVNLSAGSKNAQTYFSYANTHATGVQPTNSLMRHNFNLRESSTFFDNRLSVDASINYVNQNIYNSPNMGGTNNPLTSVYLFPRGVDIRPYKQYALPDSGIVTNLNWINLPGQILYMTNPYWLAQRNLSVNNLNRFVGTASVKYSFAPWLNVQVRGNLDRSSTIVSRTTYADTSGIATAISGRASGYMNIYYQTVTQKYGEASANFKVPLRSADFRVDGLVATSITDNQTNGLSTGGSLWVPNFFSLSNVWTRLVNPNAGGNIVTSPQFLPASTPNTNHGQLQSAFGALNASYKDWLYLSLTGRSDWSSLLAFAKTDHYFYPSAGLSFILSQVVNMPKAISYAKLRVSYAQVGNTVPQLYLTNPQNSLNGISLNFNTSLAPSGFKPEKTNSIEGGADLKFMDDRLSLNLTYYKTNTLNQAFNVGLSATTLGSSTWINAGNVQNTGLNFTLGYDVVRDHSFTWNTTFNGSSTRNKILALYQIVPGKNSNFNYGPFFQLRVGGSYGDVYGNNIARDAAGRIKVSGDGSAANPYQPIASPGDSLPYLGNVNPKLQLGWQNSFTYKNFYLSFLIDGSFGGKVWSYTQAFMDLDGVSKKTGDERAQGGVKINGVDQNGKSVTMVPTVQNWYASLANVSVNAGSMIYPGQYMYNATAVRLRELSLGYNFPVKNMVIKNVRLLVTGHNLFFFTRKAPFDPELAMGTQQNGWNGVDMFSQPSTRDVGVNLTVNF